MGQCVGCLAADNNPRPISLRRIRDATDNFHQQIREGGSGFSYQGRLNRQLVEVKRLNPGPNRNDYYEREVGMLTRLSHPNIINMIRFCADDDAERIIIYENMPSRSLRARLRSRQLAEEVLGWGVRMSIGAGVAEALSYLHHQATPRVIFVDLNLGAVLLGPGFHPKISDFGAAIDIPPQNQNFIVNYFGELDQTHNPYWANEAATQGILSPKSDVFSFGMLLLEIVTCLDLPSNRPLLLDIFIPYVTNPENFVALALDQELVENFPEQELRKAMSLAAICMGAEPDARPDMIDVVRAMRNLAGEPGAEWPAQFIVAGAV